MTCYNIGMDDLWWRKQASCMGLDPDMFFPEKGDFALEARAVCATCPVRKECLAYGIDERFGVWGGTTEYQRRILRRQRRKNSSALAKQQLAC